MSRRVDTPARGASVPRNPALAILALAALLSIVVALAVGSVPAGVDAFLAPLRGQTGGAAADIVWGLRLPRVLSAFAVGGLLALSGALLQALLRNPLGDPYLLGISSGAALGAVLALAAGAALLTSCFAAAAGAGLVLAALLALTRRALFARSVGAADEATNTVLLTGVLIAACANAAIGLLLALAPDGRLRSIVFWLLGDLTAATGGWEAGAGWLTLIVAAVVVARDAPALNLIIRGDAQAFTQGVDVVRVRRRLLLCSCVATGAAVTIAGAVGFVGFIAPHLVRAVLGNEQRRLLPAAVLTGGTLVVLADLLARTVAAPLQLPVGVVTTCIGAPLFLWLMRRLAWAR